MLLELKSNDRAIIARAVTNATGSELSDKELFIFAYNQYKKVEVKQRGSVTAVLNKEVEILTKSSNIQATFKRLFKLAFNYVDMQVVCKFDNLEYTNIANLVKLFKYVDTNEDSLIADGKLVSSKQLREEVKAIYSSDMSPHRYNNLVADKITQLKEKYKLVDTEGVFVFKDFVNTFKGAMSRMTDEQLLEIEAMIVDRLHNEVVDVEVA